jgi:hypothetical protein
MVVPDNGFYDLRNVRFVYVRASNGAAVDLQILGSSFAALEFCDFSDCFAEINMEWVGGAIRLNGTDTSRLDFLRSRASNCQADGEGGFISPEGNVSLPQASLGVPCPERGRSARGLWPA